MSRNNVSNNSSKSDQKSDSGAKNKKIRVEKGIVFGALFVILLAVFVIPKYEAYARNKELLSQRTRYNIELPDEMSEATYLENLKKIGDQLEDSKKSIPESIDTIKLYEGIAKIAELCQVTLISVEFDPTDLQIDDTLGARIEPEFMEKDEKTIRVADEKFLTTCKFEVICSGNDDQFIAFLNELNQCQPLIRVLNFEIKSETANKKVMTLKLESYGVEEAEQIDKKIGNKMITNNQNEGNLFSD